jgi:serine protease Do
MPVTTRFQKMPVHVAVLAAALLALPLLAPALGAQDVRIRTRPDVERVVVRGGDRPMIGVTTAAESEKADTLGLRVTAVEKDSPAEQAGLKVGDRLQAVNGLNLRAAPGDAGQPDYSGVLNRRLQREVEGTKEGEAIELRVLSGTQVRTVRVTPAKASTVLRQGHGGTLTRMPSADRAVLGMTITSTGTARDTLGIFVSAVTRGGPAERAGIYEGDRIAAINGVTLRVAREDAEDPLVGSSRVERLTAEMAKLKAGDAAELVVVTAGRSRTVRVTTVQASDLPGGEEREFLLRRPDGAFAMPFGGTFRFDADGLDAEDRIRIEEGLREVMPRLERIGPMRQRLRVERDVRTIL